MALKTKMSDIVNDVLTELRMQAGQDVQIHLQDGINRVVSRTYRKLHKKYLWKNYLYFVEATTDGVANAPIGIDPAFITDYMNVVAVFEGNSNVPLPRVPATHNINHLSRPVIVPLATAPFFTVYPKRDRKLLVWYRIYQDTDFGMNDEVPFDRDLLAIAAAVDLAVKSGTNPDLTKSLLAEYQDLMMANRLAEIGDDLQLNLHRSEIPTDWYENT